ncbi:hypothetical protein GCM10010974_33700 [Brevibacterium sediminis]|uniref:Uncharacterized protein n=1 Tax=Brevibacterium sediminis TaxID=1857024 RepID=A0ABQ1N0W4_9MICO|nr:hypothetical protein GCM10010974_33700 [Brevibacterium sediminis]
MSFPGVLVRSFVVSARRAGLDGRASAGDTEGLELRVTAEVLESVIGDEIAVADVRTGPERNWGWRIDAPETVSLALEADGLESIKEGFGRRRYRPLIPSCRASPPQ